MLTSCVHQKRMASWADSVTILTGSTTDVDMFTVGGFHFIHLIFNIEN